MIKAVDDHGNYSQDATWYLMTADKEINKNVIIDYNQLDVGYSGIKTNMYYNAQMQGLRLEKRHLTANISCKSIYRRKSRPVTGLTANLMPLQNRRYESVT